MRSAGNFHPEWGYLAPAPSFLRTLRIALVATAIGATAGAAVVVSLVERPASGAADSSLAAHALVTSLPVTATANKPATTKPATARLATAKPATTRSAAAPVNKLAQAPMPAPTAAPARHEIASAGVAAAPVASGSVPAVDATAPNATPTPPPQPSPSVAVPSVPGSAVEPAPYRVREATAIATPPAKRLADKRRRSADSQPVRHWRGQSEARDDARKKWRSDGGFGPLLRLFSFRTGSLFSSN